MFCGARRRRCRLLLVFVSFSVLRMLATLPAMSRAEEAAVLLAYPAGDRPDQPPVSGGGGERRRREMRGVGSRPPWCKRRCGGCAPCTAVQVRAGAAECAAAAAAAAVASTNYEPVGWKCKCGSAVFDP